MSEPSRVEEGGQLGRLFLILGLVALTGMFVFWRIDNERAERLRAEVVDALVPQIELGLKPGLFLTELVQSIRSHSELQARNRELYRELQSMKQWQDTASKLRQENSALRQLLSVRPRSADLTISAPVLSDASTPFRQSALIGAGQMDGIRDGMAVTDGIGLVGRVFGVGESSSRIILITDPSSRIPVKFPTGAKSIMIGDNSMRPRLEMQHSTDNLAAGMRIVTSGDGNLFPADALVGVLVKMPDDQFRVQPAADFPNLQFVTVVSVENAELLGGTGGLVLDAN